MVRRWHLVTLAVLAVFALACEAGAGGGSTGGGGTTPAPASAAPTLSAGARGFRNTPSLMYLSYTPPFGSPWDAVQAAAQAWVRERRLADEPARLRHGIRM